MHHKHISISSIEIKIQQRIRSLLKKSDPSVYCLSYIFTWLKTEACTPKVTRAFTKLYQAHEEHMEKLRPTKRRRVHSSSVISKKDPYLMFDPDYLPKHYGRTEIQDRPYIQLNQMRLEQQLHDYIEHLLRTYTPQTQFGIRYTFSNHAHTNGATHCSGFKFTDPYTVKFTDINLKREITIPADLFPKILAWYLRQLQSYFNKHHRLPLLTCLNGFFFKPLSPD